MSYDRSEQDTLLEVFTSMLRGVTKDGGAKRARGEKPPWWKDPSHEAAIFSHINKWKHGEVTDADSGEHPLVHVAWRCLAIAWQESAGKIDPINVVHGKTIAHRFAQTSPATTAWIKGPVTEDPYALGMVTDRD